uniref:RBD domain-containing protein n=1 Tax=Macrostomum lignano TaxID=282301 RepID=A0A1I8I5R9_9PLAT
DSKMKMMAELQLTAVNDARSRSTICRDIQQWEENLERLHIELFRYKCYMASLLGSELPNPKNTLAGASKTSKLALSRLGAFSLSAFHALVCARAPLTTATLHHRARASGRHGADGGPAAAAATIGRPVDKRNGHLQQQQQQQQQQRQPHHQSSVLMTAQSSASMPRQPQQPLLPASQQQQQQQQQQQTSELLVQQRSSTSGVTDNTNTSSERSARAAAAAAPATVALSTTGGGPATSSQQDSLIGIRLPSGQTLMANVQEGMTVQEILEMICRESDLDPKQHYIRLRLSEHGIDIIPDNYTVFENQVTVSSFELNARMFIKFIMSTEKKQYFKNFYQIF